MSATATPPGAPGAAPIFELRDVRAGYGPIEVVHGVSLEVPAGSVMALLGPNGGGKTTLLNVCAGTLDANSGDVCFRGRAGHVDPGGRAGAPRALHRARRAGDLPEPERAGEPPHGDPGRRADGPHRGRGLRPVPPAQRSAQAAGRHPLGRGAADAGPGPGVRHRPQAPPARRAVHGPGADRRRASSTRRSAELAAGACRSCWSSSSPARRCPSPTPRRSSSKASSPTRAPRARWRRCCRPAIWADDGGVNGRGRRCRGGGRHGGERSGR